MSCYYALGLFFTSNTFTITQTEAPCHVFLSSKIISLDLSGLKIVPGNEPAVYHENTVSYEIESNFFTNLKTVRCPITFCQIKSPAPDTEIVYLADISGKKHLVINTDPDQEFDVQI